MTLSCYEGMNFLICSESQFSPQKSGGIVDVHVPDSFVAKSCWNFVKNGDSKKK